MAEPEPPPHPACLPTPRWSNAEVPPLDWGMKLEQFDGFLGACRPTPCWTEALRARGSANLYDIVKGLVKPWTRTTGCSIALRMNPEKAQRAELMVSHCWGESMEECSEALQKFYRRKSLATAVVLWFCAFAQYQPGNEPGDCGPTVAEQLERDPFGSVIRHVCGGLGMVVVQTSTADVYSRLWCVYEIAEAVVSKAPVAMAFSQATLAQASGAFEALLRARTSKAKCRDARDEAMIKEKVHLSGGFRRLDSVIFTFRLEAFQEMMSELEGAVREELRKEIHRLMSSVTQSTLGKHAEDAKDEADLDGRQRILLAQAAHLQSSRIWRYLVLCLLAPLALVAAVIALPLLLLCSPCLLFVRRRMQSKMMVNSMAEGPNFGVELESGNGGKTKGRERREREDDPPLPQPACPPEPQVVGWSSSSSGGDPEGDEEDEDALMQMRMAQVREHVPALMGLQQHQGP